MKKSKFVLSVMAAALFATTAAGLTACSKGGTNNGSTPSGGGSGGGTSYTITLDANGGTLAGGVTSVKTGSDGKISDAVMPVDPSRDDYSFIGWYTQATGGTKVTTSYVFDASVSTIYAHWSQNIGGGGNGGGGGGGTTTTEYEITFNAGEGTFESGEKTKKLTTTDGKVTPPTDLVAPSGKTPTGWFEAETGGTAINFALKTFDGETTVYAQFSTSGGQGGGGQGGGQSGDPNSALTYGEATAQGAFLVGEIQSKSMTWAAGGWGNGFTMEYDAQGDYGNGEYSVTVKLQAGDKVKVRFNATAGANGEGAKGGYAFIADYTDGESGNKVLAPGKEHVTNDDDDNIVISDAGTYTFYWKPNWGENGLWLEYSAD